MKQIELLVAALSMCSMLGCVRAATPELEAQPPDGGHGKNALYQHLSPILISSGKVARIYFEGVCNSTYPRVLFPDVRVTLPPKDATGVEAVKSLFGGEPGVSVEDSGGIIRIKIGAAPIRILGTRVHSLSFTPVAQYTSNVALWNILDSHEVRDAERALGVINAESPLRTATPNEPRAGKPHLPASLTNVTFDEALDALAKTFNGIVSFGTCSQPESYLVGYSHLNSETSRRKVGGGK